MTKYVYKKEDIKGEREKYVIPAPNIVIPVKEKPFTKKFDEETPTKTEKPVFKKETSDQTSWTENASIVKNEIESIKTSWKQEEDELRQKLDEDAKKIIGDAETAALNKIKEAEQQIKLDRERFNVESNEYINKSKEEANVIIQNAKDQAEAIIKENIQKGYDQGYDDGYKEGKAEMQRLIDHFHKVINELAAQRSSIVEGAEQQIVNLIILIVRKVIKILSENQKNIIVNNVAEALKKVIGSKTIVIRLNLDDMDIVADHKNDFIKMVESLEGIHFIEDTSIERGGCIVETDFGDIDARISLQLREIEEKILELSPIKNKLTGGSI